MQNTTDNILLRSFISEDSDAVISLWVKCGLTRPWNDPHKDIQRKCDERGKGGSGWFWVAEQKGRIVGTAMAGYDGHRGSVNYLAVDPDVQGHGIGRLIMNRIEADLTAQGCPKINLLVRTDNRDVQAFYETLGYGVDAVLPLSRRLIDDKKAD